MQIAKCVDDYEEYQMIRMFCTRLGHCTNCSSAFFNGDLKAVAGFMKELLTSPFTQLRTNLMVRGLLSIMEEIPVDIKGAIITVKSGQPRFQAVSRFQFTEADDIQKSLPHLQNKKVIFVGVPATVLPGIKVQRVPHSATHLASDTDAVFVANLQLWAQVICTPYSPGEVYCPVSKGSDFPDWEYSGHDLGPFKSYRKKTLYNTLNVPCKSGQLCNGQWYPPSKLYPFIDTSALGIPLIEGDITGEALSYWVFDRDKLQPVVDPTFYDGVRVIVVDRSGHWVYLNRDPKIPSGTLKFGNQYVNFECPDTTLGKNECKLLQLFMKCQKSSITMAEFDCLKAGIPQIEFIGQEESAPKKKAKKNALKNKAPKKLKVQCFFCQDVPPLFVIRDAVSLTSCPLYQLPNNVSVSELSSKWAEKARSLAQPYYDLNKGKQAKSSLVITAEMKGVKLKQ